LQADVAAPGIEAGHLPRLFAVAPKRNPVADGQDAPVIPFARILLQLGVPPKKSACSILRCFQESSDVVGVLFARHRTINVGRASVALEVHGKPLQVLRQPR
jgi:hypothetical protein